MNFNKSGPRKCVVFKIFGSMHKINKYIDNAKESICFKAGPAYQELTDWLTKKIYWDCRAQILTYFYLFWLLRYL